MRTRIQSPDLADNSVSSAKLVDTGVVAGSYSLPIITIDAKGRITDAVAGSSFTISPGQISPQGAASGLDADKLDGHSSTYFATAAHTHLLDDISDVSPTSLTNGQVLTYNGSSFRWYNLSPNHATLKNLTVGDPHTQYQLEAEKNQANGYLGLDSSGYASPSRLGSGPAAGKVLYGNNTWASPTVYTSFTNELAQDAIGSALTGSSTIKWTYNDGANTISADVSPAGISHASLANLTSGDPHTQYQLESEKNTANGYVGLTAAGIVSPTRLAPAPAAGKVLYGDSTWASPTAVPTTLASLTDVSPGTPTNNQVLTYNAASGQWTSQSPTTGTSYTDEMAQDAVGNALTNTGTIKFTYNDGANTISADVSPAGISHASLANLTVGDPHTQYQQESEKNNANGYAGLNASNLISPLHFAANPAAGKVLYGDSTWASPIVYTSFTNELAQDAVGNILTNTSTVKFTYNDGANTISADVSPAGIDHGALGGLADDDHTQYHTDIRASVWLKTQKVSPHQISPQGSRSTLDADTLDGHDTGYFATAAHTHTIVALTDVSPTTPTTGQVLTYNGTSGQWYNASPATYTSFTNELAQDAIGSALTNTSTIKWTYNDGANTISADVSPAGISHASLANLTVGDPHTQYQQESEKNSANGYVGLNSSTLVSPTFLGTGTPSSSTVLFGDKTWKNKIPYTLISPTVSLAGHNHTLTGLSDVNNGMSGLEGGEVLIYDGDSWEPQTYVPFTVEAAQDAVGGALTNTSTIKWTYNDGANTISADVSPAGISHASLANLTTGDPHTQYQLISAKNQNSGYAGLNSSGIISPTHLAPTPVAGKVLYGDSTWASPIVYTSFTTELAQDAIGSALTNTASIKFTYNDAANTISADVSPAGVSHNSLANLTVGDPHTQYQQESEKNQANGYAGLDAGALVSPGRLASGPAAGKLLYGNQTWASPVSQVMVFSDADFTVLESPANTFNVSIIAQPLSWLSDVSPTAPTNGQVLTYDGTSGQWYNASPSSGGYTNEMAQDAVGGALTNTSTIKWTYNDGANTISADVSPASINISNLANAGVLATKNTITGAYIDAKSVSPGRLTGTQNNVVLGVINGIGVYDIVEIACTAFGRSLIDDANASAARTTLGLGTIATTSPGGVSHDALSGVSTSTAHTNYQLISGKNAANGYAGLGATSLISPTHFAPTPAAGKLLFGDSTWASPTYALKATTITCSSPILGGGDLSANRTISFSSSMTLDNNARVAAAKNSAAATGTRRQINFIEGSNITLALTDSPASERVNVTITGSGTGSGLTQAQILTLVSFRG